MRLLTVFIIITFFFKNLIASDLRIIRDAETENFLGDISKILIKKANLDLDGEKLNFYLDNKNYVNAFVTPGQNFFFTTKLLIDSKTVDELAGVIAHEIGHVVGGHFTQKIKAQEKTSMINILSSLLAVGAIASGASGGSQAGTAILLGGKQIGMANLLSYSRSQESVADHTAIRLLKNSGFSLQGMVDLFELLERNESFKQFNPYYLSHPLSSERKKNILLNMKKKYKTKAYKNLNKRFSLIKAKLNGFFLEEKTLKLLYPNFNDIESLYAYSLRYYKIGKVKEALDLIDLCLEKESKNPYFHELKGQIHYENGNIINAINSFRNAISINSSEKNFNLFLAKSLYYEGSKKSHNESINLLWSYIKNDEFPVDAWHFLGLNYGKMKKFDYSSYALAEKFLLVNEFKNARIHIDRVKKISKDPVLLKKISDLEYTINKREEND